MKKFTRMLCFRCSGHGIVSRYSHNDFEGPEECSICNGSGYIIKYKVSGVFAKYPGGSFLGKE